MLIFINFFTQKRWKPVVKWTFSSDWIAWFAMLMTFSFASWQCASFHLVDYQERFCWPHSNNFSHESPTKDCPWHHPWMKPFTYVFYFYEYTCAIASQHWLLFTPTHRKKVVFERKKFAKARKKGMRSVSIEWERVIAYIQGDKKSYRTLFMSSDKHFRVVPNLKIIVHIWKFIPGLNEHFSLSWFQDEVN